MNQEISVESPPETKDAIPSPRELREQLIDSVVRDLLGPAGGPNEELHKGEASVYQRYLVGMLAPKNDTVDIDQLDEVATTEGDDGEEGAPDTNIPPKSTFHPSSMGMSFIVDGNISEINVDANWGQYSRVKSTSQEEDDGSPATVWKRKPIETPTHTIKLSNRSIETIILHKDFPQISLKGKIAKRIEGWLISLFFVNEQTPADEKRGKKYERWIFQPKLIVSGVGNEDIFVARSNFKTNTGSTKQSVQEENETLEMLYRHRQEFAVGHGVSIHATKSNSQSDHASIVETEWIPQFEVPQQTPREVEEDSNLAGLVLDMKELAELPIDDLVEKLRIVEIAYDAWIKEQGRKVTNNEGSLSEHQDAAQRGLEKCRKAQQRIAEGIDLIQSDHLAEQAFRFANQAMWQQRVHSIYSRTKRKSESETSIDIKSLDVPENRSWRLFQLAFVLLNLPSLTNLHHPDRSHETDAVADLLWFPTGGGKTEAYLGLTAYILAVRRLAGDIGDYDSEHGIAVIMRYTLRLLTLQQFQRATTLICACESIRRQDVSKWGTNPFRIGLWVGKKTTPNYLDEAADSLRQVSRGWQQDKMGSPLQIKSCPWCGSEIKAHDLKVYKAPGDIGSCKIYCGDKLGQCEFTGAKSPKEGLPVIVVDEEIYRRPPSLLIATVDKFAQMTWNGVTQMLFGRVTEVCDRHGFVSPEIKDSSGHPPYKGLPRVQNREHKLLRPPDLIIQDELHLISGPLGSMVGLYETAVDELCNWQVDGKRVRPKVIASTATISRASDQVQKLFVRDLQVFPPHGTDIEDNFFSIQREISEKHPGRKYLGISAFGKKYTETLIQNYVAYMASAKQLFDKFGQLADPYMTLTGYFNSIRELAGTRRLAEDVIRARLGRADRRGLAKRRLWYIEELTSRKFAGEIPTILDRLETEFQISSSSKTESQNSASNRNYTTNPYDLVLATNMISVGVDIDRLGLMLVAGQPKNTSEYIQATSRVGRSEQGPGLVCTMFNWARPRDLSHYEQFEHFHDTFYKHVEPLSLTPFSARALDRGLSGIMVALIRLLNFKFNDNLTAGDIDQSDPIWNQVISTIKARGLNALKTDDEELGEDSELSTLIDNMYQKRQQYWLDQVDFQTAHKLTYKKKEGATVELLQYPSEQDWSLFTCLNSLRNVENPVNLIINDHNVGLLDE